MRRIEVKGVNPCKLHSELIAAGILPADKPMDNLDSIAWIEIPDDKAIAEAVNKIIAAHDITPLPKPKTEAELLLEKITKLETDVAALKATKEAAAK